MKKIMIICSTSFYNMIPPIKEKLEKRFELVMPNGYGEDSDNEYDNMSDEEYMAFFKEMFHMSREKVSKVDACLVLNFDKVKNGTTYYNYIGASTFLEMYEAFMQDGDGASLEKMFVKKFNQVDYVMKNSQVADARLDNIENNLLHVYQKKGIVKYDAFEMGGKLSYVVCLLDNLNNGYLINSMHSTREGCYSYIKEIVDGEALVILSEEEKQALEMALNADNK